MRDHLMRLDEQGRSFHVRFRVPDSQGGEKHVELQGTVHSDSLGVPIRLIGVAGDVTEIVEGASETERLRAQLQQSQKMETLGTMAAGVAHDFNNLLLGISGFVELATSSLGPGHEVSKLLTQAKQGAVSAKALVRRILDYSRSSRGPKSANVDLAGIVRDTAPLIAASLPSNVSLSLAIDCEEVPVVADTIQIQQILMNLATNASHAIGTKAGRIQIGLRLCESDEPVPSGESNGSRMGRHARLSVTDNGCGMSEEVKKRLFEPFFTTKSQGKGTGLGLSIVSDIIKSQNWRIEVASTPGAGTTFIISVPLTNAVAGSALTEERKVAQSGSGQRVLIVDDEPAVGAVVRLTLERSGYLPELYSSPSAALDRFKESPGRFALVVVDQNMPELSGAELVGRIRSISPSQPVLLMSGRFGSSEELDVAGVDFLKKPFEIPELVAAVSTALAGSRAPSNQG